MNSGNTEQRKLAAIMFTDMVGYSSLAQHDDQLALELLEEHRLLLRGIFPNFHGQEIKTMGDAFLVEFGSALEAAQCGIEIQRALAKRNHDVSEERRIELKIGIHIGDVVHRGGDVYGDGVNIASRIEPLAGAGGICVSMDVERQIRNALEARFERLGPTDLKNIKLPMELFRIILPWETKGGSRREEAQTLGSNKERRGVTPAAAKFGFITAIVLLAAGITWWLMHQSGKETKLTTTPSTPSPPAIAGAAVPPDQKSIAVLAFVNMSGDKENEYFSDGVSEEILNSLARTPGLRVAARTSSFHFKGKDTALAEIAKELGVAYIVEGSVRRAGDQLRITAQLIKAADGYHLWSDTFDRKAVDVFAIQTEVAKKVQEVLKVKLLEAGKTNMTIAGTDNLEAYDLYLRGQQLWNKRTGPDNQRAIEFFQQAIAKDPKFALAQAQLAASYALLLQYGMAHEREAVPRARAAAQRALELDPGLAEAHAVLGLSAQLDWDWPGAEAEYQEALRLNPNLATARHWRSMLLQELGRSGEAIAEARLAQKLDPLSPVIQNNLSLMLSLAGRLDEGMIENDKALKLSPEFMIAHVIRGRILILQNRIPEAVAELESTRQQHGDLPAIVSVLGYAYGRAGRTNEARQLAEILKARVAGGEPVLSMIIPVYNGMGDLDQVFVWLERATELHDIDPRLLRTNPFAANVVKDPRYETLLRKYGLDTETSLRRPAE